MTTATDWDVRDAETNDKVRVTDVQAALAATEPTEHERTLLARIDELATENDRLRAEIGRWTPRRDISAITGAADLTERQQRQALAAPTDDELNATDGTGMPLTALLAAMTTSETWPTWLGDVHHADKTVAQAVTDLRAWADGFGARPVERTVVEPVAVDYGYRDTEAWTTATMVTGYESPPERVAWAELPAAPSQPALPVSAEGEAFLAQGPAPAEGFDTTEALNKLKGRVKTAVTGGEPTANSGDDAVTTPHKPWWRRLSARVFDAIFPPLPSEPRKDGGA